MRADVYTRNVINEHTRELSRTTKGGAKEEERKREGEKARAKKQRMCSERGRGGGQGKYTGEDLL